MFKKNKLNISTIVLFIIYSALVLNWSNYSLHLINLIVSIIIFLALLLIILCLKILINKETSGNTKVGFGFILFCTLAPIVFPFIIFLGYWFDIPR